MVGNTRPIDTTRELGEAQEQHIREQIGKLRGAAVHRPGYFYKIVKRWRTGLIAQDTPQPPIGGTQHVLNHHARDPTYDEDACQRLIRKHVRHHTWNTSAPTYAEYLKCLRAPKNKSVGPDGVPPPTWALTRTHTETTIPRNTRSLEWTKYPNRLAALTGSAHI